MQYNKFFCGVTAFTATKAKHQNLKQLVSITGINPQDYKSIFLIFVIDVSKKSIKR